MVKRPLASVSAVRPVPATSTKAPATGLREVASETSPLMTQFPEAFCTMGSGPGKPSTGAMGMPSGGVSGLFSFTVAGCQPWDGDEVTDGVAFLRALC